MVPKQLYDALADECVRGRTGLSEARKEFEESYLRLALEHGCTLKGGAALADMDRSNFRRSLRKHGVIP